MSLNARDELNQGPVHAIDFVLINHASAALEALICIVVQSVVKLPFLLVQLVLQLRALAAVAAAEIFSKSAGHI